MLNSCGLAISTRNLCWAALDYQHREPLLDSSGLSAQGTVAGQLWTISTGNLCWTVLDCQSAQGTIAGQLSIEREKKKRTGRTGNKQKKEVNDNKRTKGQPVHVWQPPSSTTVPSRRSWRPARGPWWSAGQPDTGASLEQPAS